MFSNLFSAADISASGMSAERMRMEVVANNIANANSTNTPEGGPYKRQQLMFSAMLDSRASGSNGLHGVRVMGKVADETPGDTVIDFGHPHADPDTGELRMPNVKLPNEMVDLITASRSYEANLKALTSFKQMIEQTLSLLQGRQ
jgi:flagellar basal-body rod protein FlgC